MGAVRRAEVPARRCLPRRSRRAWLGQLSAPLTMHSYQEQLEAEQYFKARNLGIKSYWMGLRIPSGKAW